jgi:CheY-like chemotaxis protein
MPRRVILVDDNENDLLFTRIALQRCGVEFDVREFERADDALGLLTRNSDHGIELILLDINMPGMDGFDFLKAFEALPAAHRFGVAVVMLTSSSDPSDRQRADSYSSVRGFLQKPLDRAAAAGLVELIGRQ